MGRRNDCPEPAIIYLLQIENDNYVGGCVEPCDVNVKGGSSTFLRLNRVWRKLIFTMFGFWRVSSGKGMMPIKNENSVPDHASSR